MERRKWPIQRSGKLGAAGDLKRGSAYPDPSLSLSRGHVLQLCDLYRFRGGPRPLAVAKADHADVYKQLPLLAEDDLAGAA